MVYRKKILISEDSAEIALVYQENLVLRGYRVLTRKRNGDEVLATIREEKPDIVIMDVQMRKVSITDILRETKGQDIQYIVTSNFYSSRLDAMLTSLPQCSHILKPVSVTSVLNMVDRIGNGPFRYIEAEREAVTQQQLELMVTSVFHQLGIPAMINGYYYLREAVLCAINSDDIIPPMTSLIYADIAEKFGSVVSRVERAIRHAIGIAWERGDADTIKAYFGRTVPLSRSKPTNSEFITLIADHIRLQIRLENKFIVKREKTAANE